MTQERRRRKRIYDLGEKLNEAFLELQNTMLCDIDIHNLERILKLEIKTDELLDKTHGWR